LLFSNLSDFLVICTYLGRASGIGEIENFTRATGKFILVILDSWSLLLSAHACFQWGGSSGTGYTSRRKRFKEILKNWDKLSHLTCRIVHKYVNLARYLDLISKLNILFVEIGIYAESHLKSSSSS
jgi:hypothetical protein